MEPEDISGMPHSRNRGWYETVKRKFSGKQPTLSFLRQEITLKNNQSSYAFDFKNKNANSITESLLGITDAFGANMLQVGLLVREIARPSVGLVLPYPVLASIAPAFNASTVDSPSAAAIRAAGDLEAFFNGSLELKVDKNTIFDALDTRRFRQVPGSQIGVFADKNQSRYEDGQVAIEPQVFFDGARTNTITVNVPTFAGMAIQPDNPAFELALVCICSGFRVQGGANLTTSR